MKVSVKSANTHYNHLQLDTRAHKFDGEENEGRSIKNCVGSPPPDRLDKEFQFITGGNLVVDDERVDVEEDSGDGSTIRVRCPAGCQSTGTSPRVWGTKYYTDNSRICEAALHARRDRLSGWSCHDHAGTGSPVTQRHLPARQFAQRCNQRNSAARC